MESLQCIIQLGYEICRWHWIVSEHEFNMKITNELNKENEKVGLRENLRNTIVFDKGASAQKVKILMRVAFR